MGTWSGSAGLWTARSTAVALTSIAALGLGLVPVELGLTDSLLVCTVAVLLFALSLVWLLLRREATRQLEPDARGGTTRVEISLDDGAEQDRPATIRAARVLFFIGVATVGQSAWRAGVGLTVSEVCFISSFALCATAVLFGRPVASLSPALVVGVGAFALGGLISSVGAVAPNQSLADVVHYVYVMLLWGWAGAMVLTTRRELMLALFFWSVSAAFNGVGALGQIAGIAVAGSIEGHRAIGFTTNPNDLGASAAVALVPALTVAIRPPWRPVLSRAGCWALVALIVASLLLSGSVSGMAAALLAGVIWLASPFVRGLGRVVVVGGVVVALVIASTLSNQVTSPAQRLDEVFAPAGINPTAGSGQIRISVVKAAWPRIVHDPFVGTGLGNSNLGVTLIVGGYVQDDQVHDAALAAWYEAGIFGLVGILLVLGSLVVTAWRTSIRAVDEADRLLGWTLLAALTAFAVYAMTAPLYFQQYGWLAATLVVANGARATQRRHRRTERAPTRDPGVWEIRNVVPS